MSFCKKCNSNVFANTGLCQNCKAVLPSEDIELIALDQGELIDQWVATNLSDPTMIALEPDEYDEIGPENSSDSNSYITQHKQTQARGLIWITFLLFLTIGVFYFKNTDTQEESGPNPTVSASQAPLAVNANAVIDKQINHIDQNKVTHQSTDHAEDHAENYAEDHEEDHEVLAEQNNPNDEFVTSKRNVSRTLMPMKEDESKSNSMKNPKIKTMREPISLFIATQEVDLVKTDNTNPEWFCLCYEERSSLNTDMYQVATACRRNIYQCRALSHRIRMNGSRLMRAGGNFIDCHDIGSSHHPETLLSKGRGTWRPSKFSGAFWSLDGCLIE